ncbi:hypothetical protein OEG92_01370 [Polaribacter sejongensis]
MYVILIFLLLLKESASSSTASLKPNSSRIGGSKLCAILRALSKVLSVASKIPLLTIKYSSGDKSPSFNRFAFRLITFSLELISSCKSCAIRLRSSS